LGELELGKRSYFYSFLPTNPLSNLIHYMNLNISASRQDIKNLVNNFVALHVRNRHANFQASSVEEEVTDGQTRDVTHFPMSHSEISNSSLASLGRDK